MSGDNDMADPIYSDEPIDPMLIWHDPDTKTKSAMETLTSTITTTLQEALNITETQETPPAPGPASTSPGDSFAYAVIAMIVGLMILAYGIKQRRAKEEGIDNLIPPGGNDTDDDEDEFLTLQQQAVVRTQKGQKRKD